MPESPFQLAVGEGVLDGHFGGAGAWALMLHGGPAVPDYMEGCAAELGNLFTTIRYTQRGAPPSTVEGTYTIESHMDDAIAVLDGFEIERAWAVGHSWGGHLALHLAVAHPDRLLGVICIDPLGASRDVFPELRENLVRDLSEEQRQRCAEIDVRRDEGSVTEEELVEELTILWPRYFAEPSLAPPCPVKTRGVQCTLETNRSIGEHFEAGTLTEGLREVELPALFAHGIADPLPIRASLETAKLIRGARVARIPRSGHFPWLEQPGFLNRMLRGLFAQL